MATNSRKRDPRSQAAQDVEPKRTRTAWLVGMGGLLLLLGGWLKRILVSESARPATIASVVPSEPTKGHEHHDANAKGIFAVILFLLIFGLSIHGILAGFLHSLKQMPQPKDAWRPVSPTTGPKPKPLLQVSPAMDLEEFRTREEKELHSYGWLNRTAGVVRIPIERAMDLVLQEGLSSRTTTNRNQIGPSSYDLIRQRPERREREIQDEK